MMEGDDDVDANGRNVRCKAEPKILDGKYFVIKSRENDNVKATCILCGAVRSGSIKGTGNFTRHYNDKHPERKDELYKYIKSKTLIVQTSVQPKINVFTHEQVKSAQFIE